MQLTCMQVEITLKSTVLPLDILAAPSKIAGSGVEGPRPAHFRLGSGSTVHCPCRQRLKGVERRFERPSVLAASPGLPASFGSIRGSVPTPSPQRAREEGTMTRSRPSRIFGVRQPLHLRQLRPSLATPIDASLVLASWVMTLLGLIALRLVSHWVACERRAIVGSPPVTGSASVSLATALAVSGREPCVLALRRVAQRIAVFGQVTCGVLTSRCISTRAPGSWRRFGAAMTQSSSASSRPRQEGG